MTTEGTLVDIDGRPALRFSRRYPTPVERVWRAVTDPAEMAAWFPSSVDGDRAVGADLSFGNGQFTGRVIAFDPPTVFSFTWGGELLRFELTPDGDETVLVFTQLLSDRSVAARNGAGWHQCLAALDRRLGADVDDAGWQDVYHDYLERMGPEPGVPAGNGALRWDRVTHVEADRVREVAAEPAAWGAGDHAGERLRWDVEATEHGSAYRLTHEGIDGDADLAAAWHALLIQLDMYLASGQVVPVDPDPWREAYAQVLG